jgi:hypothetical protein
MPDACQVKMQGNPYRLNLQEKVVVRLDRRGGADGRRLNAAVVVLAFVRLRRRRIVCRARADRRVRVLVAPLGALVVAVVLLAGDDRGNSRGLGAAMVVLGLPCLDAVARRMLEVAQQLRVRRRRVAQANGDRGRGRFPDRGSAQPRRRSQSQPYQARRPPLGGGG